MLAPHTPSVVIPCRENLGGWSKIHPLFFCEKVMQIKIRIPRFIEQLWTRLGDWTNVPVYTFANGREILRLDIMLVIFGIFIAIYYLVVYSWQTAVIGVATYIMVVMMALWIF
jgi:hypothetical protein